MHPANTKPLQLAYYRNDVLVNPFIMELGARKSASLNPYVLVKKLALKILHLKTTDNRKLLL